MWPFKKKQEKELEYLLNKTFSYRGFCISITVQDVSDAFAVLDKSIDREKFKVTWSAVGTGGYTITSRNSVTRTIEEWCDKAKKQIDYEIDRPGLIREMKLTLDKMQFND